MSLITLTPSQGLPCLSPHATMAPSLPSSLTPKPKGCPARPLTPPWLPHLLRFLRPDFFFFFFPRAGSGLSPSHEGLSKSTVQYSKSNKNKALMGSHGTLWHLHLRDTGQQGQCSWWTKGVVVASLHSNELFNHSLNEVSNRDITRQLHHSNPDYLKHVC